MREVFNAIQAKAENTHILVVGDVMLDEYVWGSVSHISPEAPVPVVDVSGTTYVLGGASNVANNLRQLGCKVSLMGIVGDDTAGDKMKELLGDAKINYSNIITNNLRLTTKKTRIMAHNQQLIRMDLEEKSTISDVCVEHFSRCLSRIDIPHAIIFSDYSNGMYHPKLFKRLAEYSSLHGIPLMVDPKGKYWERYCGATAITPNMEELSIAVGFDIPNHDRLKDAADTVYNLAKYQYLLVTQGKNGMTLFQVPWDEFSSTTIPIKAPLTVYDVSGAGDTVMAIFALGLALKQDPLATAELANIVAGIVVGKLGTATTNLKEIEERLNDVDPTTWHPKGKILSYNELLTWERANHYRKTALVTSCFCTIDKVLVSAVQELKDHGYTVFCDIYSHKDNSYPLEDRIQLAASLENVDFVLDTEFEYRATGGLFFYNHSLDCPLKAIEEKMFV